MSKVLILTDDEKNLLRGILSQLLDSDYKRGRLALTADEYIAAYGSGQSSRKLGKLHGVNANHFNRVWRKQGLDLIRALKARPAWYERTITD